MSAIILASQSPRRKMLLEWAEIPFEVVVADIEETYPLDLSKQLVPEYIAANKALATKEKLTQQDACIIAADTIVLLKEEILGKPTDEADAIRSLEKLSGNLHEVITGVAIYYKGEMHQFSQTTKVQFHKLTKDQIQFYVERYKPFDKAGAYAIQEWIGVIGIESIQGDFYNVMGLPVSTLVQKLQQLGVV
ncbi:MAG: Maf family nucleotide pyrophosphatase [Sediminibacterium sp.]|jgi:septum formation protein